MEEQSPEAEDWPGTSARIKARGQRPGLRWRWESGRKWTNLRSKVGDADWTRPPMWAVVSQPQARVQSLLPRKQLLPLHSAMEPTSGVEPHIPPACLPPGSPSPLRFNSSLGKVTVENKEPDFRGLWWPGRLMVRVGRAPHLVRGTKLQQEPSKSLWGRVSFALTQYCLPSDSA